MGLLTTYSQHRPGIAKAWPQFAASEIINTQLYASVRGSKNPPRRPPQSAGDRRGRQHQETTMRRQVVGAFGIRRSGAGRFGAACSFVNSKTHYGWRISPDRRSSLWMMAYQHSLPAGSIGSPSPRAALWHQTEGVALISAGSHRRSPASSQGAYVVALWSVIGGAQWRLSGESAVQRRPNRNPSSPLLMRN